MAEKKDPFTPEELSEMSTVMQDEHLGRAVRVRWVDSGLSLPHRWMLHDDALARMNAMVADPVESVGLWMGENEHVVMIGQSRDHSNENWMAAQLIWKQAIVSTEWI